jgi:hypothetical protein
MILEFIQDPLGHPLLSHTSHTPNVQLLVWRVCLESPTLDKIYDMKMYSYKWEVSLTLQASFDRMMNLTQNKKTKRFIMGALYAYFCF